MLSDKYRPVTLADVILDDKSMDKIIAWINSWNRGLPSKEKPALLMTGFPGTGKTTTARCICNDAEWNLIEFNASDSRRKEDLKDFKPERSIFGNITCILFDEADSFGSKDKDSFKIRDIVMKEKSGNTDKTGVPYVKELIESREFPIILTANNIFKVPKDLKSLCEPLQIYRPSYNALKAHLFEISMKEGLPINKEILDAAAQSQDYRMGLSMIENKTILQKNVVKTSIEKTAKALIMNVEINVENIKSTLYNLDTNISQLYNPLELYQTYEIMVRADILRRRGQEKHAAALLKTIPKTTLEDFEMIPPVFIDKKKQKQKEEA